jgi:hypothetical protein
VPDVAAAQAFYADVLGWTFPPGDGSDEYGGYVIGQVHGAATAGIGPLQSPGQPVAWTLYFASDDADFTASSVQEHGGTVLIPAGDIGTLGRMLIALDPTGAAFGIWQAVDYIGVGLVNEPGALCWEDLRSPDPDTARAFYTGVFGYTTEPVPMAGPDYTTFALPGEPAPLGGMGGMMGADGAPPHWLVYFGVTDTPAAVATAERGGGSVLMPLIDSPFGRLAVLADPAGAAFCVIEPDAARQPDRSG